VRVFLVDTFYERVLDAHYARHPELARAGYREQWLALMQTCFGTFDAYSHYLGLLGHDAHEVVANCVALQRAWAREARFPAFPRVRRRLLGRDWRHDVLCAQADAFEPDVVYVQDLHAFPTGLLRRLGHRRLLVGQIGTTLPATERFRPFDLVVTSVAGLLERISALGVDTEYLRIGFDPRVLERLGDNRVERDVVFVGGLQRGVHAAGNEVLARAAERLPVEFWGYGADDWPSDSTVRRGYRGEAWGRDMYRVLASARIALNRHGEVDGQRGRNMRLYEATGVGTLLLTDTGHDVGEDFDVGAEIVTYADEDDLVERAQHYLRHEDERAAVARAGQRRTLREHSYEARMRELADMLADRLG
jgi:spore maturation protein CgeB